MICDTVTVVLLGTIAELEASKLQQTAVIEDQNKEMSSLRQQISTLETASQNSESAQRSKVDEQAKKIYSLQRVRII